MGFGKMRHEILVSTAVGLMISGAGVANAQQAGGGGPVPGAGDSTRITSDSRDANAAYNQRISSGVKTTNGDDQPRKKKGAVPATAADIKAGSALRDAKGVPIGTIVSADANQAVVDTGQTKIGVPLNAFGKDDQGLLLSMTADQFNQAIAKAHAKSHAADSQEQASH
jgi:hypothetical protein